MFRNDASLLCEKIVHDDVNVGINQSIVETQTELKNRVIGTTQNFPPSTDSFIQSFLESLTINQLVKRLDDLEKIGQDLQKDEIDSATPTRSSYNIDNLYRSYL